MSTPTLSKPAQQRASGAPDAEFRYVALTQPGDPPKDPRDKKAVRAAAGGQRVKGTARAPDEATVIAELRARRLTPVKVTAGGAGLNRSVNISIGPAKVKPKSLVVMSRQLAVMLTAGSSLTKALDTLVAQTEDAVLLGALRVVSKDVRAGKQLSEAMEVHALVFPPLMTSMVRAGEVGGFLAEAVENIAQTIEYDYELRESVKSALVYPVTVTIIAVLALYGMIIFLVPIFAGLYDDISDGQTPLPLLTRAVVAVSQVATWIGPPALVAIVVGSSYYARIKNKPKVRERVDAVKVRLPVFGQLSQKAALARFCGNFSQLVNSGVQIGRALEVVAPTVGNYQMAVAVLRARDAVSTGKALSAPLRAEPLFPPMILNMLAVGEDNGKIGEMVATVGGYYRREVTETTSKLKALLDPFMIVGVGSLVGLIVIALFLPYFNIGDVINNSNQ